MDVNQVLSPATPLEGAVQLRLGDEFSASSDWQPATLTLQGDALLYSVEHGEEGVIALEAILTPPQRMSGWTWGNQRVFCISRLLQPVYVQAPCTPQSEGPPPDPTTTRWLARSTRSRPSSHGCRWVAPAPTRTGGSTGSA